MSSTTGWKKAAAYAMLLVVLLNASARAMQAVDVSSFTLKSAQLGNWRAFGAAVVESNSIRLTTTVANERGAVWNPIPVPYEEFEIQIDIAATGSNDPHESGEGLSLWLTTEKDELGPVFGGKDMFNGLAVMFDSMDHDGVGNNPSISAHLYDGTHKFDHATDGIHNQLAGCIADYRNRPHPVSAKIKYSSAKKELLITVDLTGTKVYRRCLIQKDVVLPNKPLYLGISAENLDMGDVHSVYQLKFNSASGIRRVDESVTTSDQKAKGVKQSPKASISKESVESKQKPDAPSSTNDDSDSVLDETLHQKMNDMLRAAADSAVHSRELAEVLREVETNIMNYMRRAIGRVESKIRRSSVESTPTQTATSLEDVAKMRKTLEQMQKFDEESIRHISDQVEENERLMRQLNAAVKQTAVRVSNEMKPILQNHERMLANMLESRQSTGIWAYIIAFQLVFVIVLVLRQTSMRVGHGKIL